LRNFKRFGDQPQALQNAIHNWVGTQIYFGFNTKECNIEKSQWSISGFPNLNKPTLKSRLGTVMKGPFVHDITSSLLMDFTTSVAMFEIRPAIFLTLSFTPSLISYKLAELKLELIEA